ncbi:GlcNAc-PI de-N-acetylase [Ruminococcaceae bacterium YRB3002]|nr:GlcNAc-PI de-N-acetylase [Ruminococcaceae bacterium YRB3002]
MTKRRTVCLITISLLITLCLATVTACITDKCPTFDQSHSDINVSDCLSIGNSPDEIRFVYYAQKSGYYNLCIHLNNSALSGSVGIHVRDHFIKLISRPDDGDEVSTTFFCNEGKNLICIKKFDGDLIASIERFVIKPSDHTIKMVIVPHEDDEIFAFAGSIQQMLKNGDDVRVVFLTNGDYFNKELGPVRISESLRALEILGVVRSNITFLGYGDALISSLFLACETDEVFESKCHLTETYGDSSQGVYDYHFLNSGNHASYSGNNIREDLLSILDINRPEAIFVTSTTEWHPDHKYLYAFMDETIKKLNKSYDYHPSLCQSVIHGDSADWPQRLEYDANGQPIIVSFTTPFSTSNPDLSWEDATHVILSDDEINNKYEAIKEFVSQNEGGDNYKGNSEFNFAFCKEDEFYWIKQY